MENGLAPNEENLEPISFEDVIKYWQDECMRLHQELAVANARIANRERTINLLTRPPASGPPVEAPL